MAQRQDRQRGSSDGVLALLHALHARVQPQGVEGSLRMLLPAYERLLRPVASISDQDRHVMHELQRIRSVLKSESDLFDAAQTFDQHVELCLQIDSDPRDTRAWPMSDALRLLLALSGGDDGATFVLEDPTRVRSDVSLGQTRSKETTMTRRLGERIHMGNVEIVTQAQHTLLQSTALPFATNTVVGQYDFTSFAPAGAREAALWYPEGNDVNAGVMNNAESSVLDSLIEPFQSSSSGIPRLIDIPSQPEEKKDAISRAVKHPSTLPLKQRVFGGANPSPSGIESEVFFFDASNVIKTLPFDVSAHEGSVTDASSKGDEDVGSTASWLAFVQGTSQIVSWEELGTDSFDGRGCLSRSHTPSMNPLQQPITLSLCRTIKAAITVEVDEADLIDSVAKALCGIDSVVFRRDVTTAVLRLSRNVATKLRTASPSSLESLLEEFRVAGTAFMRLEYLSVYYSQNPSRGGKTAQALALALQLFLSAYQGRISDQVKAVSTSSCFVSLIGIQSRTRAIRKQVIELCRALTSLGDSEMGSQYWRVLTGGEFPRGVALLNLLHQELQQWEQEDVAGAMTSLWRWLLVRTAEPFVSLLSSYVASGQTPLELDPFGEFRLSVYNTLQGLDDVSVMSADWSGDLVPHFLERSLSRIVTIGRLQQMLCSILPQTDMLPLDGLRLELKVRVAQSQLDRTRELVSELTKHIEVACNSNTTSSFSRRTLRSPLKSPRTDEVGDVEWIANKRKRLEVKREVQQAQRDMLDDMIREREADRDSQVEAERRTHDEAGTPHMTEEAAQVQRGKELLMATHGSLVDDAESRHRYLKWRRDRAVRLSSSKTELAQLYGADQDNWQTERQTSVMRDQVTETEPTLQECTLVQLQESDVVMAVDSVNQEPRVLDPAKDVATPTKSVDVIGDGGLLWRPRIRTQNVPGGGGDNAMATMYPDRRSGSAAASPLMPQRNSVIVTQADRHEGSDAYVTIYGSSSTRTTGRHHQSNKNSDQDVELSTKEVLNESMEDVGMDTCDHEPSPPLENGDVEMTKDDDGLQAVETVDRVGEPTSGPPLTVSPSMKRNFDRKNGNPALAILRQGTNFLRREVSLEDANVLRAILHPEDTSSSKASIPFQSLMECALEEPIALIHDFVDRMALRAMVVKLNLKAHLLWLHRIALMSEGLCMTIFTRDLFSELQSEMRVLLALPGRLTTSLAVAMIEARVVTTPAQLPAFEYRLENGFVPAVSSGPAIPSMVEVVHQMTLNYNVSQHLAAVLTPRAILYYQQMHQFLLLLRLTEQEAKATWLDWRKSNLRNVTQCASTRRACDLALHSAQTLLIAFLETFANQVLETKWTEFFSDIDSAHSVSRLRAAHEHFSCEAFACCFLRDDQVETLQIFHALIECVWTLGKLISAAESHGASMDLFQAKLHDIVSTQATAMNALSTQLFRLESSTDRSLYDFAKHFLLRLNLNGFFTDAAVTHTSTH